MNKHTCIIRKAQKTLNRKRIVRPHCCLSTLPRREETEVESEEIGTIILPKIPAILRPKAFDPELLYVECGRCGAPVIWEEGRASKLLKEAGIDPLELDASCILVTDACPMCSSKKKQYTVQIFRVSTVPEQFVSVIGNA